MENVGQKIRKIRELRNVSRQYMAKQMMISMTTYGKIERDELDITLKRLSQIAKILGVTESTIIDFDENKIFSAVLNRN